MGGSNWISGRNKWNRQIDESKNSEKSWERERNGTKDMIKRWSEDRKRYKKGKIKDTRKDKERSKKRNKRWRKRLKEKEKRERWTNISSVSCILCMASLLPKIRPCVPNESIELLSGSWKTNRTNTKTAWRDRAVWKTKNWKQRYNAQGGKTSGESQGFCENTCDITPDRRIFSFVPGIRNVRKITTRKQDRERTLHSRRR